MAVAAPAARADALTGHIAAERPESVYVPFDVPPAPTDRGLLRPEHGERARHRAVRARGLPRLVGRRAQLHSGPQGEPAEGRLASHRVRGRRAGWYRGDLHAHTIYSDGGYRPRDIVAGARAARLEFFVSTEHDTDAAPARQQGCCQAGAGAVGCGRFAP